MKTLPPCDHDECPPTRCLQTANAKGVGSSEIVVPMGIRAARKEAKLRAANTLQNMIMDGEFDECAKPLIWGFIDRLRAQRGKRHNDGTHAQRKENP